MKNWNRMLGVALLVASAGGTAQTAGGGHFQLQSELGRTQGRCLEANVGGRAVNGASFMNNCGSFTGQLWRAVPTGRGSFQLQSAGGPGCLEANDVNSQVRRGGAFVDACQPVTGQNWSLVPLGNDLYQLRSANGRNQCLEGNEMNGSVAGGAAHRSTCGPFTGQAWRLIGARIVNGVPIGML